MIIQSSNKPIILEFDDIIDSEILDGFRATLWDNEHNKLKSWTKDNVTVESSMIILPLLQTETALWSGIVTLEVKWLNNEGYTEFSKIIDIDIAERDDVEEI